jgi:hypothetical protein
VRLLPAWVGSWIGTYCAESVERSGIARRDN